MARRSYGDKEPCKNLGVVVKNTVKYEIPINQISIHGSVYGYLLSCENPAAEASLVFSNIFNNLQGKLKHKDFSITELWRHLAEQGVNPVDIVFPKISNTHIWSIEGVAFVPNFSSQTEGNPSYPAFDYVTAVADGQVCDALIKQVLSLPSIAYTTDTTAGFLDPRARIFSLFLTSNNPFSVCAQSTELSLCFDAWVDELSTMDEGYKMMGVSWVLHSLKDLPGVSSISHPCPLEFLMSAEAIVDRVLNKISAVRVSADLPDPHDSTGLNRYGVIFDYLDVSKEKMVRYCKLISEIGNHELTISVMDGLVRSPKNYAQACRDMGLSSEMAFEYLGQNLSRAAWFNSKAYSDIPKVSLLLDAFRDQFMAVGYPDPAGTVAFDFLALSLESAEHFEKLDFIRREQFSRPSMFLKHYDGLDHNTPSPDDVVIRKVEMAIKLNQKEILKNEIDLFFKGHKRQSTNSDLGSEKAIKHVLESGYFDASEILINDSRREKVMSMGVSGKAMLPAGGASRRIKAMAIEHDLGL